MTSRLRVAVDRIVPPEILPQYVDGAVVYALVALSRPLHLRYVGVTMSPYTRWATHTRAGVGALIEHDSAGVGMMLLSDVIPDRWTALQLEKATIKAAKAMGMCDMNMSPRSTGKRRAFVAVPRAA